MPILDTVTTGVILTGVVAYVVDRVGIWSDRRRAKASISAGLKGEITSILYVVERRSYEDLAKFYISKLEAGQNIKMPRVHDKGLNRSEILSTMCPFFHTHMKDVGILDPNIVSQLSLFYNCYVMIQIDTINFARGDWDDREIESKIAVLKEDLCIWEETKTIGEKLIKIL